MVSSEHTGELKAVFWLFRLLFGPSSVIKSCFTNSLSFPPPPSVSPPSQRSVSVFPLLGDFPPSEVELGDLSLFLCSISTSPFPPPSLPPSFSWSGFPVWQAGDQITRSLGGSLARWHCWRRKRRRDEGRKEERRSGFTSPALPSVCLASLLLLSPQQPGDRVAEPGRKTCNPPSSSSPPPPPCGQPLCR